MSDLVLVWDFVRACTGGVLRLHECGPVWSLAAIALFLCGAVVALIVVRARSTPR